MSVQIGQQSSARAGDSLPAGSTAAADASDGWTANSAEAWPESGSPPSMCTCPNDSASWNASANSARYEPHLERDRNQPIVVTRCASLARLATAEPFRRPHRDVSYNVTLWQSVDLRFLWRVAKSPQCEERGGSRADQSSDTSASWITLAQSCVSAANSFAASALVLPIGSICSLLRMASAVAGSLTTSATSLLILS